MITRTSVIQPDGIICPSRLVWWIESYQLKEQRQLYFWKEEAKREVFYKHDEAMQDDIPTGKCSLHFLLVQVPIYSPPEASPPVGHSSGPLWKTNWNYVLKDGDTWKKSLLHPALNLVYKFCENCFLATHCFVNYFNWAKMFYTKMFSKNPSTSENIM